MNKFLNKTARATGLFLSFLAATVLCACGAFTRRKDEVKLDLTEKTAFVGEAFKLKATATGDVAWSSDDEDVLIVNSLGTVTALAAGTASVIARCGAALAMCFVTVIGEEEPDRITLDVSSKTVEECESFVITATPNKNGEVSWSTSNKAIATVTNGVVKAVSAGRAVITATFGTAHAECSVIVEKREEQPPEPDDEVSLDITERTLDIGRSFTLIATHNKTGAVSWSTSDASVAAVNDGTVKAVGVGNAVITAAFGTARATCTVTVTDPDVFDLEKLNNAGVVANVGKWYYWAGGDHGLTEAKYDHGTLTLAFTHVAANDTYQLRIQPFAAGTEYTANFTVALSAAGTALYGTDNRSQRFDSAGEANISYKSTALADKPFMVQVRPLDATKPIKITVSNVEFVKKTVSPYIADNYADCFSFGAAVSTGGLTNYADQLKHFNSFTPENDMKWKNLEATEGKYTYGNADKIISYAASKDAGVRGHCLVWYKSLPSWLTGKAVDKASALSYMEKHIENTMRHFGNKVYVWDVANEALRNSVNAAQLNGGDIWRTGSGENIGATGTVDWYALCGTDFIKRAFSKAAEVRKSLGLTADDMKLYYNDYGLNNPHKRAACVKLVQMLQSANIPIDGVGMQAHYRLSSYTADKQGFLDNFEESIKAFTALGIDVQITELDVRVYASDAAAPMTDAELEAAFEEQGEMYGEILKICKRYATPHKSGAGRITNVTTWGVSDSGTAWDTSAHKEYPFIFDKNKQPKPAVSAILNAAK